jgi:hypothetical protein
MGLAIIDGKVLLLLGALLVALAVFARVVYVAARREAGWAVDYQCWDCGDVVTVVCPDRDTAEALTAAPAPVCLHCAGGSS